MDGQRTDVGRLAEIGNRGVDLLLGDSTNAERPGYTLRAGRRRSPSGRSSRTGSGRVLVSTFASNVHRLQQAVDVAVECGRKVCVVGRSMRKNLNIARNLEYVRVPDGVLIKPADLDEYRPDEVLIMCTGSPGRAALGADADRVRRPPAVKVERGDTVIISAKPIPGTSCASTTRSTG